MVVTEALARGLPVVATDVGGVTEALGHGADGIRPGLLVPPDDPAALAAALRAWLTDAELREPVAAAPPASAARRSPDGRRPRAAGRRRPGRGVAMTAEGIRVSPGWLALREPADAAARRPTSSTSSGDASRRPAGRSIHDLGCGTGSMGRWLAPRLPGPQHWVVHDRDADLLAVAAADLPGAGRRRGRGHRRDRAVRHHPAGPGRSRRREPDHRLGAARPADRRRAGRAGHRLRRRRLPGAADALRGRSRRADPGRSAGRPAWPPHSTPTSAARPSGGRLLGPDAVAVAVEEFGRLGAEVLVRPSPWRLGAAEADLAAEWFTGWVGAACEQQARAGRRDRRLRTPTPGRGSGRPARRHRGPRRPAGPADDRRR